jgi:hypothetical protein
MHYGHELQFGTFITPRTTRRRRPCASRSSPRHPATTSSRSRTTPTSRDSTTRRPCSRGSRPHRTRARAANVTNVPLRPPRVLAPRGREPRPAERGPLRARPRGRRLLGRDRRHGRPQAHAGQAVDALSEADRHHPRHLGPGRARPVRGRRQVPPCRRRQARAGAGAQHPHLDRRPEAADAALIGGKGDGGCRRSPTCKPGDLARATATIDERRSPPGATPARSAGS